MSTYKGPVFGRWLRGAVTILLVVGGFNLMGADLYVCGDMDGDGSAPNVADLTYFVDYLFGGGPAPSQMDAADCNGDTSVDVGDLTWLVDYLFAGGIVPLCDGIATGETYDWCTHELSVEDSPTMQHGSATRVGEYEGGHPGKSSGTVEVDLIAGDLYVYHYNALYQCCLGYDVEPVMVSPGLIVLQEVDTAETCNIVCYFDLEWVWEDIPYLTPNVTYAVVLLGIDGDTAGIDTLVVTRAGDMETEVVGNALSIHHTNAWYNCCPAFFVEYVFSGNEITVFARDTVSQCYCDCLYNLDYNIYGLDPGQYTVSLYGSDLHFGEWLVGVDTVVVGG